MKLTKIDRRVNRTRRLLREALFELILELGYDAITIEQITDRADLGRTTFYLHYRDKEDLLLESIETIADDLRNQVEQYIQDQVNAPFPPNPILLIFQHAALHAPLYRIILRGGAANSVLSRIREMISDAALEFFQQRFSSLKNPPDLAPGIPTEVTVHAFAASLLGLMTWWLEQGMHYTPEQISVYFRDLFFNGALDVLGDLKVPPVFGVKPTQI
jgi:AcrR family transcriptional regulator